MSDEVSLLSADDILEADDYKYVDVDVSEWWGVPQEDGTRKGSIRIRALAADEALSFFRAKDSEEAMINLVAKCAVDCNGDKLFSHEQVKRLRKKSFAAFAKIQNAGMKLNGLDKKLDETKND